LNAPGQDDCARCVLLPALASYSNTVARLTRLSRRWTNSGCNMNHGRVPAAVHLACGGRRRRPGSGANDNVQLRGRRDVCVREPGELLAFQRERQLTGQLPVGQGATAVRTSDCYTTLKRYQRFPLPTAKDTLAPKEVTPEVMLLAQQLDSGHSVALAKKVASLMGFREGARGVELDIDPLPNVHVEFA
jgi:hypothetical protein